MKGKVKTLTMVLMLVLALVAGSVSAQVDLEATEDDEGTSDVIPATVDFVKINGHRVESDEIKNVRIDRGETIDVAVKLTTGDESAEDVVVEAEVFGDEHYVVSDDSRDIDMNTDDIEFVDLELEFPERMDIEDGDEFQLRITVADRDHRAKIYNYDLRLIAQDESVIIRDAVFTPSNQVKAGRALLSIVRLENLGEDEEESVKVTVSIPDLGVSASDFIDEIEEDDVEVSEELYLRIPKDAKSGVYNVFVDVEFDDGFERNTEQYQIEVIGDAKEKDDESKSEGKTILTVGPETQDIPRGKDGGIYAVTLKNEGSVSKSYTIGVTGTDAFADVQVSPSTLVTLGADEEKQVFVFVGAREDASEGTKAFSITVSSGGKLLKEIPLQANVVQPEDSWGSLKRGLQIGLAVLVVLLIILLAVVGYQRMKEEKDEDDDLASQTYY